MKSVLPTFQRFCPGCAQRKLQMNAAPCEICGRVNLVEAPRPRESMHLFAKMLRALLRPLGRFAQGLTLLFCGFMMWGMVLHDVLPLGVVSLGTILLALMVAGIWIVRFGTRGAVWLFAPATRGNKRGGGRNFLFLSACLAMVWGLYLFDVPLRVGFWLSRPALEQISLSALPAPLVPALIPDRAGLYRVKKAEFQPQGVRIKVTDDDFFSGGTSAGFAKCPGGCQNVKFPPAYPYTREPPKYIQLSRDWFWWEESGDSD